MGGQAHWALSGRGSGTGEDVSTHAVASRRTRPSLATPDTRGMLGANMQHKLRGLWRPRSQEQSPSMRGALGQEPQRAPDSAE
eukprot:12243449-Alexandrium_andersonii.AAC.1